MGSFSIVFTNQSDIDRWQKILDKGGKLGPKQQARWDEWHRTKGRTAANVVGEALLEKMHREFAETAE